MLFKLVFGQVKFGSLLLKNEMKKKWLTSLAFKMSFCFNKKLKSLFINPLANGVLEMFFS